MAGRVEARPRTGLRSISALYRIRAFLHKNLRRLMLARLFFGLVFARCRKMPGENANVPGLLLSPRRRVLFRRPRSSNVAGFCAPRRVFAAVAARWLAGVPGFSCKLLSLSRLLDPRFSDVLSWVPFCVQIVIVPAWRAAVLHFRADTT